MRQALAIEREAVARYAELADMMQAHNNREVAGLFRQMADYERHHVEHILAEMGWDEHVVSLPPGGMWTTPESPEAVPIEEMHYLMQPWHALQLALAAERRAQGFFAMLAAGAQDEGLRRAAEQMRDEEAEHVALIESWLSRVPAPAEDWAVDPDPPRLVD
jgi:rubrerythrin